MLNSICKPKRDLVILVLSLTTRLSDYTKYEIECSEWSFFSTELAYFRHSDRLETLSNWVVGRSGVVNSIHLSSKDIFLSHLEFNATIFLQSLVKFTGRVSWSQKRRFARRISFVLSWSFNQLLYCIFLLVVFFHCWKEGMFQGLRSTDSVWWIFL